MMTKIEALNYTITLWQYLADHPQAYKRDAILALNMSDDWICGCPCCAYDEQFNDLVACSHCPIWTCENRCGTRGEAYDKWLNNPKDFPLRSASAQQIVDLAKAKLQEELVNAIDHER